MKPLASLLVIILSVSLLTNCNSVQRGSTPENRSTDKNPQSLGGQVRSLTEDHKKGTAAPNEDILTTINCAICRRCLKRTRFALQDKSAKFNLRRR